MLYVNRSIAALVVAVAFVAGGCQRYQHDINDLRLIYDEYVVEDDRFLEDFKENANLDRKHRSQERVKILWNYSLKLQAISQRLHDLNVNPEYQSCQSDLILMIEMDIKDISHQALGYNHMNKTGDTSLLKEWKEGQDDYYSEYEKRMKKTVDCLNRHASNR